MFGKFKKKEKKYPAFTYLLSYKNSDNYFSRIAEWDWQNKDNIVINDPNEPRIFTLDHWPQLVFIAANGQMTIREYIYFMASKYDNVPELLDKEIISQIDKLLQYRIIELKIEKSRPDSKFELPKSQKGNI
ncbi:MAG: hypothetical protein JST87_11355 [Bacteroidetes bacterium]|nr:hypothetical protein [Bacteroidota bacterium]